MSPALELFQKTQGTPVDLQELLLKSQASHQCTFFRHPLVDLDASSHWLETTGVYRTLGPPLREESLQVSTLAKSRSHVKTSERGQSTE